jgi:hypothetical protein
MIWQLGLMPPEHRGYPPNELLGRLVGMRLYSGQFVMDYVQLRFDGPTQDIPRHVVTTEEGTGKGLRIAFDEAVISLHSGIGEAAGPEIALLNGFQDGRWMCWRPGEESFEDLA